jgi:hypothetical protein
MQQRVGHSQPNILLEYYAEVFYPWPMMGQLG